MLIIISQDVIKKGINHQDDDHLSAIDALKKILLCVKWRKHIVCAPDMKENDINSLKESLTKEEIKLLEFIHRMRNQSFNLINQLSIYTIVTYEGDTRKINNIIYINPNTHTFFELYEETHFIVENILDAIFYEKVVCNYYQHLYNLKSDCFSIVYYPVQGGGVTISDVLGYELNLGHHFCFVVCDSDKKSDNSKKEGDTAKGVRTVFREKGNKETNLFNSDFYIMSKVREIENLIPFSVLLFYSNKSQKSFINDNKDHLLFFDMKAGLEYRIFYDDLIFDSWKRLLPDLTDWNQIEKFKADANDFEDFCEKVKCLPKKIDGWGSNILKKILYPEKILSKEKKHIIFNIKKGDLTADQKEEWDNIGKQVFSWCCCFTNPPR